MCVQLAAARRAKQLGLSYMDQHSCGPSNDCTRHDRFMRLHYSQMKGAAMMHYPQCFQSRDQMSFHNFWDKAFTDSPASFQASTQLAALEQQQKERPCLYDRPLRPGGAPLIVPSFHPDTLATRGAARAKPAAAAAAAAAPMDLYEAEAAREQMQNENEYNAMIMAEEEDIVYEDM